MKKKTYLVVLVTLLTALGIGIAVHGVILPSKSALLESQVREAVSAESAPAIPVVIERTVDGDLPSAAPVIEESVLEDGASEQTSEEAAVTEAPATDAPSSDPTAAETSDSAVLPRETQEEAPVATPAEPSSEPLEESEEPESYAAPEAEPVVVEAAPEPAPEPEPVVEATPEPASEPTPEPTPEPEPEPEPEPFASAPAVTSYDVDTVIATAKTQLGVPYGKVYKPGESLSCFHLVHYAWASVGVEIDDFEYFAMKDADGWITDASQLRPGDLVWYSRDGGADWYHVALYIGDGQVIHENGWSWGCVISPVLMDDGFVGGGLPMGAR